MASTLTRPSTCTMIDPRRSARPWTRRHLLGGLAAAGALAVLQGCSSDDSPDSSATSGATRSVETAHGVVQIPTNPTRVVCTDFYTTYALLDVGFTPAGTAEATVGGVLPSQQSAYDALAKVGKTTEINYEAVAALGPDLILGTQVPGLAEDLYDKLSQIAPTALFAASSPGDWKTRAVRAADMVGRREAGERLATEYDARVASMKQTYAQELDALTWALLRATTTGAVFVDGPTSWSGVVLADLGANLTKAAPTDKPTVEISAEGYDALADSDVVLYLADASGTADPNTAKVIEQPVFQGIVGEQTELVPLSSYYAAHYLDGQAVLDQIEKVLQRAG